MSDSSSRGPDVHFCNLEPRSSIANWSGSIPHHERAPSPGSRQPPCPCLLTAKSLRSLSSPRSSRGSGFAGAIATGVRAGRNGLGLGVRLRNAAHRREDNAENIVLIPPCAILHLRYAASQPSPAMVSQQCMLRNPSKATTMRLRKAKHHLHVCDFPEKLAINLTARTFPNRTEVILLQLRLSKRICQLIHIGILLLAHRLGLRRLSVLHHAVLLIFHLVLCWLLLAVFIF